MDEPAKDAPPTPPKARPTMAQVKAMLARRREQRRTKLFGDGRCRVLMTMDRREGALVKTAAAVCGMRPAEFLRMAAHTHAVRVMLAAEHRPCRLVPGAKIWRYRGDTGELVLHREAGGEERVWPLIEVLEAPVSVAPDRRAMKVDIPNIARGTDCWVATSDLVWPAADPEVEAMFPRFTSREPLPEIPVHPRYGPAAPR